MAVFCVGILFVVGTGFSVYTITNLPINAEVGKIPIEVHMVEQNFLRFNNSTKLLVDGDKILSDRIDINLSFNKSLYESNDLLKNNSGIYGEVTIPDSNLFNFVSNNVLYSFVTISSGEKEIGISKYGEKYLANDTLFSSLYIESSHNKIIFNIPFYEATSDDLTLPFSFYILNLNNNAQSFAFNLSLNFNVVDDTVGYSTDFNWSNFSSVNVELSVLRY